MPAFPTIFGGPIVSGIERSSRIPTQKNTTNRPCGIPRILLGIATLGISELVTAVQNFRTAKQLSSPDVQRNIIRLYNYNVVDSMTNPYQESTFPGAMHEALALACSDLRKYGFKPDVQKHLSHSLKTLKMNTPQMKEKLTYELMVMYLSQEIKYHCLEEIVSSLIQSKLSSINPVTGCLESVDEQLIKYIIESRGKQTLYKLAALPSPNKRSEKMKLGDSVVQVTENLGNQLQNMLNSTYVLNRIKEKICTLLITSGQYTEEDVRQSKLYKDTANNCRITLDMDDHKIRREHRNNTPRKSVEDYQKLLSSEITMLQRQLQTYNSSSHNNSNSSIVSTSS